VLTSKLLLGWYTSALVVGGGLFRTSLRCTGHRRTLGP